MSKEAIKLYLVFINNGEDTEEELMSICDIVKCPECGSLVFEDDLISTEQTTGIGSICEQCIADGRGDL